MQSDLAQGRERLLLAAEGDWPYRRDLTDIEAASGVDVPDLDHAGQLALERMLAAWHPMRAAHVSELLRQVERNEAAHPPGDASWIASLELPPLNVARLVAGIEAAIDAGYALALDEARRQSPALAAEATRVKRADHAARIHAYALGAERLLARSLIQTASREAFRLTATTEHVDTVGHVKTVLGDAAMLYERDVLQGMATGSVTEGRYEVMEAILGVRTSGLEAAEGQATVYALEILDGNTCDACAEIDGQDYATLAEARADYPGIGGGYVACLGRERCRGTLVIVYDTEAPPTQTEPTPDQPGPPPPPPAPLPVTPPAPPAAELSPAALDALLATGADIHFLLLAEWAVIERAGSVRTSFKYRAALRKVMTDHGVDMAEPEDIQFQAGPSAGVLTERQVQNAASVFPRSWSQHSNAFGALKVKARPGRAGYSPAVTPDSTLGRITGPKDGAIGIQHGGSDAVVAHELAHRMEQVVPGLPEAEAAWKARRNTRAETAHRMRGYPKDELFIEDEFPIFYTGKVYDQMRAAFGIEFHEVLSTGIEALVGQRGAEWDAVRADADHMRFILGLLAALA